MKKRLLALVMAGLMVISLSACKTAKEDSPTADEKPTPTEALSADKETEKEAKNDTEKETELPRRNVTITMLNSKPEITDALKVAALDYESKTGVKIDISETSDAGSYLTTAYAGGDVPTLSIVSETQIRDYYEYCISLNDEKWVEDAGDLMVRFGDNDVYAYPLTIESKCVLFNKTAIERTIGREFNPADYLTYTDFKLLVEELVEKGMETPLLLNSDDWSIGNHVLSALYSAYDNTKAGAAAILKKVSAGETSFSELANFNSVIDVIELFKDYNINRNDPLAADYDLNCAYFAEGDVAFWINGTFVWADMEEYVNGDEYGVMPYPTNNNDTAKGKIVSGVTKWIIIDGTYSTEEQQQAAKEFLTWLSYTEEGQKLMVDDCGLVPALSSITRTASNDLNASLQKYIQSGDTMCSWSDYPSDHRSSLSGYMQMFLADTITRDQLVTHLDEYWRAH